jgi:DNA (cytosine-5)-methyltransferase 1
MEIVDLFSGIGGISWALRDYTKTGLYCEIDPFCQQVLAERMQSGLIEKAPIHCNIKTLHLNEGFRPKMICGGFPCQDISCIGLQKGIVDSERSSLFFEIMISR